MRSRSEPRGLGDALCPRPETAIGPCPSFGGPGRDSHGSAGGLPDLSVPEGPSGSGGVCEGSSPELTEKVMVEEPMQKLDCVTDGTVLFLFFLKTKLLT